MNRKWMIALISFITLLVVIVLWINRDRTPERIVAPYIHVTFEGDGDPSLLGTFQSEYLNERIHKTVNHWNITLRDSTNRPSEMYISYLGMDQLEEDLDEVISLLETELAEVEWTHDVVEQE